ncbi:MAG TPA: GNAT family N-acetyltransferase [Acidimicrobiales bacterium]|nr:GNAT family N-acetyltransferase [Acidimicrobiales bacterium]
MNGEALKHRRVYEALLRMASELPADTALPTERELCASFAVSRSTVRRALHELEVEQRVYRQQGRGTFVAGPKIDQLLELTSHTEDMRAHGVRPGSKLVDVSRITADGEVASKLELPVGAEVLRIERVRLADGEPIAIEALYVDAERFDDLMSALGEEGSFYQLLHRRYGVDLASADETIEAVAAGEREAELLGTVPGAPMLLLARRTVDTSGRSTEYVRSFYRGDRFRFRAHLERPRPAATPAAPTFRLGREEDAPELAAVFADAWRAGYGGIVDDAVLEALDDAELTEWLRGLVASRIQATIVALDATSRVVGFARVGDDPDDARRGQIYALYVRPDAAGRGVGRALLQQGLDALAARGRNDVTLWVFKENERARALYASCGFVPDGTQRVEAQFGAEEVRMLRTAGRAAAAGDGAPPLGAAASAG